MKKLNVFGFSFGTLSLMVLLLCGARESVASEEAGIKVATVDVQKALQSSELGKKAKAQLEKDFNQLKKQVDTEESTLRKLDEEFKKQSLVMNDEARAKKQAELQDRFMRYQELRAKSQSQINGKEKELTQPLIDKIRSLISELAKTKGYALVLEKNDMTVLYSLEKDDLTQEVIALINKQK